MTQKNRIVGMRTEAARQMRNIAIGLDSWRLSRH
jgi:hypothetical protein